MRRALTRLYRHWKGFSHQDSLKRLREGLDFEPHVIYDIGAHHGHWTRMARKIFPRPEYVLFEANPDNTSVLQASGERHYIAALAAEDGAQREFYLPRNAATSGASLYREQTLHYLGDNLQVLKVETRRLDALASQHRLPPPDLIKLDVQGAELDVLRGAGSLLKDCSALIAEISFVQGNEGAPNAGHVISGIEELGFRCGDICKARRTSLGNICQADLLLVNAALYEKFLALAGIISSDDRP
jgi:FkbM family methyltransferase